MAGRTAELSPLGCCFGVAGWQKRPTRRIARAEAHESRVGFRAVFRTSPVEWNAWRRPGERVAHAGVDRGSPGFSVSVSPREDELWRGLACGRSSWDIPGHRRPQCVSSIPPRYSSADVERCGAPPLQIPRARRLSRDELPERRQRRASAEALRQFGWARSSISIWPLAPGFRCIELGGFVDSSSVRLSGHGAGGWGARPPGAPKVFPATPTPQKRHASSRRARGV